MYTLLFYFFISLSINNNLIIEANYIPIHGYTFDLIHRFSPNSPSYNSSMTHLERYQSLALHSASRKRHFKLLENNNFETNLVPSNGDYLMLISLGVPPVDLYLIADTSTDLMWVQCKICNHCNEQRATFDPNQSSTYRTVSCDSQYCPNIPTMECDSFTNECRYRTVYGDGTHSTTGVMAKDIITLGSRYDFIDHSVNSTFVFGCELDLDEQFDNTAAGFIGLSGGQFSLASQLGNYGRFSYCLTPINSTFTSKFRLGSHVVAEQGAVRIPLLNRYLPTVYAIRLLGISIDQRIFDIEREIFIDSTSMLTYIDPSICSSLEEAVEEAIGVQPMSKPPMSDVRLCYDKNSGFIGQPELAFHFDGGEIVLSSSNIFIDLGDALCFAVVPSEEDGDPMVFGNVAQVNFEVEFDLGPDTMSFTPENCASESTKV